MHCLHQIEWLHIKAKHKESYIFILATLHDLTFFFNIDFYILYMQTHVLLYLFRRQLFFFSLILCLWGSLIFSLTDIQDVGFKLNLSLTILTIKTRESHAGVKTCKCWEALEEPTDLPPCQCLRKRYPLLPSQTKKTAKFQVPRYYFLCILFPFYWLPFTPCGYFLSTSSWLFFLTQVWFI